MDDLTEWLSDKVTEICAPNGLILDVGAYHGDFTLSLWPIKKFKKAILFEPNQQNLIVLEKKFENNTDVKIVNVALSDKNDQVNFYFNDDFATGSVLNYEHNKNLSLSNINTIKVDQITLDSYIQTCDPGLKVSIIKIDTQGNDLNVLRGSVDTLKANRPVLIVELIFVNLYKQQAHPYDIMNWLREQNYTLAGMFNEHYTCDGWLAFSDAVFIPSDVLHSFKPSFIHRPTVTYLKSENAMLRKVCEERLELINRLHNEAQKLMHGSVQYCSDLKINRFNKFLRSFYKRISF